MTNPSYVDLDHEEFTLADLFEKDLVPNCGSNVEDRRGGLEMRNLLMTCRRTFFDETPTLEVIRVVNANVGEWKDQESIFDRVGSMNPRDVLWHIRIWGHSPEGIAVYAKYLPDSDLVALLKRGTRIFRVRGDKFVPHVLVERIKTLLSANPGTEVHPSFASLST